MPGAPRSPASTARPTTGVPACCRPRAAGTSTPSTRWPARRRHRRPRRARPRPRDRARARRLRALVLGRPGRRHLPRPGHGGRRHHGARVRHRRGVLHRFFGAMRTDLTRRTYETWGDLLGYMDGSAAVIGEMMLPVLRPGTDAVAPARALGLAFQLTNFLRDVGEDLDRGRVYVPQEDLRRFGADPHARVVTPEWRALMAFEIERNRGSTARPTTASRRCPGLAAVRGDRPGALRPHPRAHRGRRLRRLRLPRPGPHVPQGGPGRPHGRVPRADAAGARRPRRARPAPRRLGVRRRRRAARRGRLAGRPGPQVGRAPRRHPAAPRLLLLRRRPGRAPARHHPGREQAELSRRRHEHRVRPPPPGRGPRRGSASAGPQRARGRRARPAARAARLPLPRGDERPRRARAVPGVRRVRRRRPARDRPRGGRRRPVGALGRLPHEVLAGERTVSPWCAEQVPLLDALGPEPRSWPAGPRDDLPPAAELGPDAEAA